MSNKQKTVLRLLFKMFLMTILWIGDLTMLVILTLLSWTIYSSTWLLGKLSPLKLKIKESLNDTRTATSEKDGGKQH